MKNGKPSHLFEIRYNVGPEPGYPVPPGAIAYGNRMAWLLNSEDISFGTFECLHMRFSKDLSDGAISITSEGTEWWFRYVDVGVGNLTASPSDPLGKMQDTTLAALLAFGDKHRDQILAADRIVRKHAGRIRFVVRSRDYKKYVLKVATTIPDDPRDTELFVSVISKETQKQAETRPLIHGIHSEAFRDASAISLRDLAIATLPDGRLEADWSEEFLKGRTNVGARPDIPTPFYTKLVHRS